MKAYQDDYEKIPFDLLVGVSKRLEAAPLRFSLTFSRLNRWDTSFIQHVAIGADVFLGENIYIAGGYNFRRRDEMKISESSGSSRTDPEAIQTECGLRQIPRVGFVDTDKRNL